MKLVPLALALALAIYPVFQITLAEILWDKGYQTAHFGKWHLSGYGTD